MPRWDDEPEDDWHDDGEPIDEDDDTVPCPYCGGGMFDDSERCPRCGSYISREDAPPRGRSWWIIVGVVAALYAVYRWTF